MKNKIKTIFYSLGAVAVCSLLIFTTLDNKIADIFQRFLPGTPENPKVVMINLDDAVIDNIGTFPISRDVFGKSLIVLKDLGVESATFDINFFDKSPAKIDKKYISEDLTNNIRNSFDLLKNGSYTINRTEDEVYVSVNNIIHDSDSDLRNGLKFFDNAYLNVAYMLNGGTDADDQTRQYLEDNFEIKNIVVNGEDSVTPDHDVVTSCLLEFLQVSKGAGSVNGSPDKDGYLRRVHLVHKYHGKYYPQLVFAPLLKRLGNPQIIINNSQIILVDAKIDSETKKTICIPRGEDGTIILKFPMKLYDQYNAVSMWNIYRLYLLEQQLANCVYTLNNMGVFNGLEESPVDYLEGYNYLREELYNGEDAENEVTYENYEFYRNTFFEMIDAYLDAEKGSLCASPDSEIKSICGIYNEYKTSFAEQKKIFENSMAIYGVVATGTTDVGINQYEERYPNTGAHYTILNQILGEDFVDDTNPFVGIIIAVVLCLLYALISSGINGTGHQIFFGLAAIFVTCGLSIGVFLLTRIYFATAVPVSSLILAFIFVSVLGYISASNEKKFITGCFSQCLSPEVVKEIVADPSTFKLGGQNFEMTAIFTDIQKFSSFSELLSASQLVALLNYYLTKMSDIILSQRGTVDKFEGDAIIAFVGAPIRMEDHAIRAVSSAIKMKAAEKIMNEEIKNIAACPKPDDMDDNLYSAFQIMVKNNKPIFTRIGLNSGEMVAGYMGSDGKKNYTMMGNNVNLASRLEGVNKQYSTGGILVSESTRNLLGDKVVVRRLDKVRVVNVNTPIRLYEPLAMAGDAGEDLLKYVQAWEFAMDTFEAKEYDKALEMFQRLSGINPADNTAKYYIKLIETFFIKGTYPKESDNFGVEYMPEDKVFKLLQK